MVCLQLNDRKIPLFLLASDYLLQQPLFRFAVIVKNLARNLLMSQQIHQFHTQMFDDQIIRYHNGFMGKAAVLLHGRINFVIKALHYLNKGAHYLSKINDHPLNRMIFGKLQGIFEVLVKELPVAGMIGNPTISGPNYFLIGIIYRPAQLTVGDNNRLIMLVLLVLLHIIAHQNTK